MSEKLSSVKDTATQLSFLQLLFWLGALFKFFVNLWLLPPLFWLFPLAQVILQIRVPSFNCTNHYGHYHCSDHGQSIMLWSCGFYSPFYPPTLLFLVPLKGYQEYWNCPSMQMTNSISLKSSLELPLEVNMSPAISSLHLLPLRVHKTSESGYEVGQPFKVQVHRANRIYIHKSAWYIQTKRSVSWSLRKWKVTLD